MGATRSRLHKKRATGGTRKIYRNKKKYELARSTSVTKMVTSNVKTRIHSTRVRGGNKKFRALRLHESRFSWGTESCTRKARILDVVYNATSNELVRTKTLVKGAVIQIDATPFRSWYDRHYGVFLGKKGKGKDDKEESKKVSKDRVKRWAARGKSRALDKTLENQFKTGRLLARISSRPGQVGRADGYILEGKELEFYQKKMEKKKSKK
eukprot:NODE_3699_length_893_cov_20.424171_g3078_i0.p2 GENE.NODE_3699_length_893_cov_20.424171_g3078_i0~~NODE_3699_length_893_cov_20.424171_g3078_i0.p2  ORF type:complete len:210 (+),score=89.71 NODE_3699_length_893_cov_20.424171_g3078_i0:96-725(+)